MYYDDLPHLEAEEHIYASGDLLKAIAILPQRPLPMTSFYLNYMIWGMNAFYFRAVNAVILALTAFMAAVAFFLAFEIAGPAGSGRSKERQAVALLLGFLFLIHPVQTYFVAYIVQRMGLLSCLFYFSTLAAYLATRTGRIVRPVRGYSLCALLSMLALASKENALTLPVILILAEIAFFQDGWKSIFKRMMVFAAISLVPAAAMSMVARPQGWGRTVGIFTDLAKYFEDSGLTFFQVIVSQCRVLFSYLALIAAPVSSNLRFTTPHVIYSSPLESPIIAAAVLGVVAILGLGIYLLRRRPLTGFGMLFFLVTLAPESLLVPQFFFFAYRAVLPMFGLLLALGDGLLEVLGRVKSLRQRRWYQGTIAAGLLAMVALMSASTISRARLWQDPILFWTEIVQGFPTHEENMEKGITTHGLNNLAGELQKKNKHSEAVALLDRSLEVDPSLSATYIGLGNSYVALGDWEKGESYLKKAVEMKPDAEVARYALAIFYLSEGRLSDAWPQLQKAVDLAPWEPRFPAELGSILVREGSVSEAAHYFRHAIELSPGFAPAHYNLGEAYVKMGMDREAESCFKKALELKPANWRAHNSLGLLLAQSGSLTDATAHFREALALSPRNWRVHNNLGALLAKSGNLQEAAVHFQEAVKINPEDISAKRNLERVRRLLGPTR